MYDFIVTYCKAFTYIDKELTVYIAAANNFEARKIFQEQYTKDKFRLISCKPIENNQSNGCKCGTCNLHLFKHLKEMEATKKLGRKGSPNIGNDDIRSVRVTVRCTPKFKKLLLVIKAKTGDSEADILEKSLLNYSTSFVNLDDIKSL